MTAVDTPKQRVEQVAADLGLTIKAVFVPWSQSRNKAEKHPSLNWRVTLCKSGREVMTTDYMAGCGHCPSSKNPPKFPGKDKVDPYMKGKAIEYECEHGHAASISITSHIGHFVGAHAKPILPELADVIHSLVLDADAIDHPTYESWAGDLGYDADSRKGESIYRQCLEIALKLRAAIGEDGLSELREACQDY